LELEMLRHVNLYTKFIAQAHPDDMGADVLQSALSLVEAREHGISHYAKR
jgi:hypothetical protein